MDGKIRFLMLHAAVMLLLPAGIMLRSPPDMPAVQPLPMLPSAGEISGSYRVLDMASGEVFEVPVRDYLIGAVGAEMPASNEPEALKAQVRQAVGAPYLTSNVKLTIEGDDVDLYFADFDKDYCKMVEDMKAEDVQRMAQYLLNAKRCIEVTMLSE